MTRKQLATKEPSGKATPERVVKYKRRPRTSLVLVEWQRLSSRCYRAQVLVSGQVWISACGSIARVERMVGEALKAVDFVEVVS